MNTSESVTNTEKFQIPNNWGFLYWPNQLLSAMMLIGSLGFSQERLFDAGEPLLLRLLIAVLVITSILYFGHLQVMKLSVENGELKSNNYKFFEPVGYLLVITALSAWAYLLSEASYFSTDLKVATAVFCSLFVLHGFLMFKLNQLRKKLPLKQS